MAIEDRKEKDVLTPKGDPDGKEDLFDQCCKSLSGIGGRLAAYAIIGMTALVAANTIFRALPGVRSFTFAEEFTGYLYVAVVFLGLADTFRSGDHVRVTVLRHMMPLKLRNYAELFLTAIAMVVMAIIGWFGVKLFLDSYSTNEQAQTLMQTPLWIPQAVVPIGSALFLLILIGYLRITLKRLKLMSGDQDGD